jgi:hypothetical protein
LYTFNRIRGLLGQFTLKEEDLLTGADAERMRKQDIKNYTSSVEKKCEEDIS